MLITSFAVLERLVEQILKKHPNVLGPNELEQIRKEIVVNLQKKYPEAGIQLVEGTK